MSGNKQYDEGTCTSLGEKLCSFHCAVEWMRTKATLHLLWESAIVWILSKMKVTAESKFH